MDNWVPPTGTWFTLSVGVIVNVNQQNQSIRIDLSRRYTLSDAARVIPRSPDTVQIGTDSPRCVVVHDAPSEARHILEGLNGASTVAQVLLAHDADPLLWSTLLEQLMAVELLVPVEHLEREHIPAIPGAHLIDERSALVHRHSHAAGARILQARDDALVVVQGGTQVAKSVGLVLAASGIGHIHHDAARPTPWAATSGSSVGRGRDLGASLRSAYPTVRVHPPASHQHPTIVLLAGDQAPDLGTAASLVRSRIPHLVVTSGVARAVVGPLVLPGRSSCLSCAHLHRTDADPHWPAVARQLAGERPRSSAVLSSIAACLAAGQVLDHIDGVARPDTVDGTLEWRVGDLAARRRTWPAHPNCGCRGQSDRH